MARPRTLGPTISFRLPVDLHAIADERARLRGLTVAEYLADRITEALSRHNDHDVAAPGEERMVTTYFKEKTRK